MSTCLFVTSVLLFHVGLMFIFCWRWQVIYVSLCSHAPVCDYPALQLSVDKIIIIIIEIIIIIIINKN